jgi:hypothetical protein
MIKFQRRIIAGVYTGMNLELDGECFYKKEAGAPSRLPGMKPLLQNYY